MSESDPRRVRLEELLADRALVGLSAAEELELERLRSELGLREDETLERAASVLDQALAPTAAALPATVRARLASAARDFKPGPTPLPAHRTPPSRALSWSGWLAAAAVLVVFLMWRQAAPGTPSPAHQRAALLARADTLRLEWSATEQAPGAGGDIAWSQSTQSGVLSVKALAVNDPRERQYQLWIFDEAQEHPIDGGVFDVTAAEVLVPVQAKLAVTKPTLFAVTIEKPGGVVVSDQRRIVLVAKP